MRCSGVPSKIVVVLNFVRFRTLLLALDCDDKAEVWGESTIRRSDNGQTERDRVYKAACRDAWVAIFCDED